MTWAGPPTVTEELLRCLRKDMRRADDRLKVIDAEVQRLAEMVAALYELRYHKAPPPVKRPLHLDEEDRV